MNEVARAKGRTTAAHGRLACIVVGIGGAAAVAIVSCSSAGDSSTDFGNSGGGSSAVGASNGTATGNSAVTGGDLGFDGGASDGAMNNADGCGSVLLTGHTNPGNIVVVFDQSDSMIDLFSEPDGGVGAAKYKVARDALAAALTPIAASVNAGSIFFPTSGNQTLCSPVATIDTPPQIAIEPGAKFVTDFEGHFSAPGWSLILGTPLKVALDNANAALPDPSPLLGARAVVILTDGEPTCDPKVADILAPVQAMALRGIKTYAVGLPGSAPAATLLNEVAAAGGTGMYFSPGDPAALQAALAKITSTVIDQCTIVLDPAPQDPSMVHLLVTDASNANAYECPPPSDAGDGWSLSPDGKTATLLGATCDKAKSGFYTSLDFVYGCPVLPK